MAPEFETALDEECKTRAPAIRRPLHPAEHASCDVVVIGAGPAGAISALLLARSGLSVRLVERKRFPRRKVCGACLSEAAVGALRAIGLGDVLRDAVPLSSFRLASRGRSASVPLRGGCVLSRTEFDAALVAEAMNVGASFEDGVTAEVGPSEQTARVVTLHATHRDAASAERKLHAHVVVFAAGLAGTAFRHDPELRSRPTKLAHVGAGAEMPSASDFYTPGTIFMATHRAGYVGLTRTEDGALNIAAALDARFVSAEGSLGAAAAKIVRQAGFPNEGLAELDWTGTPPLTRQPASVSADRLFLVGDAAGYVEPFTGEGMGWAIAAATALAPIASAASREWSPALIDTWTSHYRRSIGRRQRVCRFLARGLRSPLLVTAAIGVLRPFPAAAAPVLRHLAAS
ncbi:MAG: FAD-dependent monooxygenase [Planctomycetaceae bacterium]|nr:FAD-dependent monooxygenase [Planctomycetaceae bacterium]